jgi:hypothetical protein
MLNRFDEFTSAGFHFETGSVCMRDYLGSLHISSTARDGFVGSDFEMKRAALNPHSAEPDGKTEINPACSLKPFVSRTK